MNRKVQQKTDDESFSLIRLTGYMCSIDKNDFDHFQQVINDEDTFRRALPCSSSSSCLQPLAESANAGYLQLQDKPYPISAARSASHRRLMFKGFVRIIPHNSTNDLTLADACKDEYVTRISLDGRLLYSDHRITAITGFMPHEVLGQSAYDYIIPEDHSISLFAHRLSMHFLLFSY